MRSKLVNVEKLEWLVNQLMLRVYLVERLEKCEDIKNFSFLLFCLVGMEN